MAENYPKSKLKLKKLSVKEFPPETAEKAPANRSVPAFLPGTGTGETERPAAAWWGSPPPPSVWGLWGSTLQAALQSQIWEPVPDLPPPTAPTPPPLKGAGLSWCDPHGEVPPLPEPAPPPAPPQPPPQQSDPEGGGPGGGARLQSCPMCLQEFPAGFSQMDCDGHLAQCLSEVNVDVTW